MSGSARLAAAAGDRGARRRVQLFGLLGVLLVMVVLLPQPGAGAQTPTADPFPQDIVDGRAPTNGCGSQGEDGTDVPDMPYPGVSFTPGCDWHDQCYGTKGLTQSYCDLGMYAKTVAACDGAVGCREVAAAYHLAVATLGGEPYRAGQLDACDRDPTKGGRAHGDPHIVTLDGLAYDVMTAGEFTLVRDAAGTDIVQARFFPTSDSFTVISGLGVRLGDDIATATLDPDTQQLVVALNGTPVEDSLTAVPGGFVDLNDGLVGADQVVSVWSTSGVRIDGIVHGDRIDISVDVRVAAAGELQGLLGDGDDDPADDLVNADTGEVLDASDTAAPSFVRGVYASGFAESWRVDPDDSMFGPGSGFDYHGDEARSWPREIVTLEDFFGPEVEEVRTTCREEGLEGVELTSCMFDVLVSGDEDYAATAATSAVRATSISHPDRVEVSAGRDVLDGLDPGGPGATGTTAELVTTSPLVEALLARDDDEVRRLIAAGEPLDVASEAQNVTPLGAAVLLRNPEGVRLLLDAGADPNLVLPDIGFSAPLQLAAAAGDLEILRLLLDAGATPEGGLGTGTGTGTVTPLGAAVASPDAVQLLLDAGANPNGVRGILPPLAVAASSGQVDSARLLVQAGAAVDVDTDDGVGVSTPLVLAVVTGRTGMVEYLLSVGADPRVEVSPGTPLVAVTLDPDIRALLGG